MSNIPEEIQEAIESRPTNQIQQKIDALLNSLTAPLMADTDLTPASGRLASAVIIPDTAVRHDRVAQNGVLQFPLHTTNLSTHEIGVGQVHVSENFLQVSPSEVGIAQVSTFQAGLPQASTSQIRIPQVSTTQVSLSQFSPYEAGIAQINTSKGVTEKDRAQVGMTQVGTSQFSISQVSTPQAGITQIGTTQVGTTQVSPSQVGMTQVSPTQIGKNQTNPGKISFTSGVAPQQFFGSDLHNSYSQSVYDINTSVIALWNSLLKPQAPLDINLVVKDLPTGQLAEAQITHFDSQGRPNSGTLLIDTDANGLGWFIDPTPFEHSEYNQTLSDSAFQASTNSAAFGRYDLYTALLHEMGHLAGFIEGYEGFDRHIQTLNGSRLFVGSDFTAALVDDHLDPKVYPHDLFSSTLTPSVRKLPSALDVQLLNAIRSEDGEIGRTQH